MNEIIDRKLMLLPDSPGCYLMKHENEIIYVGKAVNLKNRVRSYFHLSDDHSIKVREMVKRIDDFEIILCQTNLEALTLECNLIKENRPFFNILLKDDKQYPYLRINTNESFPRLELVRKKKKDKAKYFGPYIGASLVREVLHDMGPVFQLRNCKMTLPQKHYIRPCMQYEIGRCLAPCAGQCTQKEYNELVKQAISFLNGNTSAVKKYLRERMTGAAENREYELAAMYRDRIKAMDEITEHQSAVQKNDVLTDVWAVTTNMKDALLYVLHLREGKIVNGKKYLLQGEGDGNPSELLSQFLLQIYDDILKIPRDIYLNQNIPDADEMEQWLREKRKAAASISVPMRGEKKALVDIAVKNAKDALSKHDITEKLKLQRTIGAVESLGESLGMNKLPRRIEGFDISNIQGSFTVASMVVFIDGKPAKKAYRRFKIKTVEGPDDFASMHEVILRRFKHGIEEAKKRKKDGLTVMGGSFSDFPDAILVDGGSQQLDFAIRAMHEAGGDSFMFGLAKRLEEIYLPNRNQPIILDKHDPALHLLQRVRDEAHRFAITYHRSTRDKALIHSDLLNVKGVGKKRLEALFKSFKSISAIKKATLEELNETEGIDKKTAKAVFDWSHGNDMEGNE